MPSGEANLLRNFSSFNGKTFCWQRKAERRSRKKATPLPCSPSFLPFPCTPCKFLICCARLRTAACKAGLLLPATPLSPPLPPALHVFLDSLRLLCELFFGSPRLALPRLGSAFIISHNHLTVQRKSVESARRRAPFSLGRRGAWQRRIQFGEKYFVEQAISSESYARLEILSRDSRHESM